MYDLLDKKAIFIWIKNGLGFQLGTSNLEESMENTKAEKNKNELVPVIVENRDIVKEYYLMYMLNMHLESIS